MEYTCIKKIIDDNGQECFTKDKVYNSICESPLTFIDNLGREHKIKLLIHHFRKNDLSFADEILENIKQQIEESELQLV